MGTSAVLNGVESERQFPLVAKLLTSGMHVLFVKETEGTVIVGDKMNDLGEHSFGYISCFDNSKWQILDSVTITFKS